MPSSETDKTVRAITQARQTRGTPGSFGLPAVLRQWFNVGLDLVFPPRCSGCGRADYVWCPRCSEELANTPIVCRYRQIDALSGCVTTGTHTGKLQQAIHGLKYERALAVVDPLGQRLAACLQSQLWTIDISIPVPLHTTRLRERGYNQAQLLGEALAVHSGIPCVPEALKRNRETRTQVGLNRQERLVNVVDAFLAEPEYVENRTIVLIDDVCTTGATLQGCASVLLTAGASAVYGLTVSVAKD